MCPCNKAFMIKELGLYVVCVAGEPTLDPLQAQYVS